VTAAVSPAAVSPLAPVIGALSSMTGRHPVHGLVNGLYVADRAGWIPATEIVHGEGLDDMLAAAGRRCWTRRRCSCATATARRSCAPA
jgi:hypothetical protein